MCAILLFAMTYYSLRTLFNAQSYANGISIGQNYNKQRIWLANEIYFKLNSTCF